MSRGGKWLRIERTTIILLAVVYVANTIVELADMISAITLHPSVANAIWVANVLTFSLLYWQIDRGGPYARASKSSARRQSRLPRPNPSSTQLKRIVDFVTKNQLLAMYAGEAGTRYVSAGHQWSPGLQ